MMRRTFIHRLLAGFGLACAQHANSVGALSGRKYLFHELPLAGFQYHRAPAIWRFLQVGEPLRLIREPHNPYDHNAVAIWFRNEHLGYVPRNENSIMARLLDQGALFKTSVIELNEHSNPWKKIRYRAELIN